MAGFLMSQYVCTSYATGQGPGLGRFYPQSRCDSWLLGRCEVSSPLGTPALNAGIHGPLPCLHLAAAIERLNHPWLCWAVSDSLSLVSLD